MLSIQRILEIAAPLKSGFSIQVSNPPWEDLRISDLQQPGPHGCPTVVVSYSQDGRTVYPEMSFELQRFGDEMKMMPLSLKREQTREVEYGAMVLCGEWVILEQVQKRHADFAQLWNEFLLHEHYVEAFASSGKG